MSAGVFCTTCGANGVAGQRFCRACGTALDDPQDPWVGTMLAHYRVERVIARGGMGVVYQAYDTRLERNVALKLLREDFASDPDFHQRFLRESRAAAGLDHQNILPVFEAGEADGTLYIATRLVSGVDLRRRLEQDGTLDLGRALSIVGQVGSALDFAHARGLVHRDVKPANILLVDGEHGEDEHAYLIDFGITKNAESDVGLTATGHFVGTPEYIAPEQIGNDPVDGRADQYALAGVLFHCLTGSSAFDGPTTVDVLHAHIHTEPPRASDVRSGLPGSVDAAMTRALSKNPARRFQTCRAFVAAARAGADPATPVSTPVPSARTVIDESRPVVAASQPRRAQRIPAARVAVVAGVLVVLAGAGVAAGALIGGSGDGEATVADDPGTATIAGRVRTITAVTPTGTGVTQATQTQSQEQPAPVDPAPAFEPTAVELRTHALSGYDVGLPTDWALKIDDETQPTEGDVTRRRTEIASSTLGVSVVIDHLERFDLTPRENRAQLDKGHANHKPGYQRISFDEYEVGGLTAFEWRYSFLAEGRTARRVDIMFGRAGELFAVLTGGRASYADLATLARRVAESITPSGTASATSPRASSSAKRPPGTGTYSGIGIQHGDNPDDFRISMTFSSAGSTIEYPDLGCSGTLQPAGYDGTRRVYRERITSGPCDQGGNWKVHVASTTRVTASWSRPTGGYTVTARLTR